MDERMDMRDSVVRALIRAAEAGLDLMVLVSDSTTTSRIQPFAEGFPDRLVNLGIAEQDLVGFAAGMALGGRVAVTANAAPFLVGRANEQVKVDVCYARSNVKMLGINGGLAYGSLGASHHSIDDISTMLGFGNVQVFAPSDAPEAEAIAEWVLAREGPAYLRVDSAALPLLHCPGYRFVPGALDPLAEGGELAIFACGAVVAEAVAAVELLAAGGIAAALYGCPSLRPFDAEAALRAMAACGGLALSVEEHSVHGGLGGLLAEAMADSGAGGRLSRLGVPAGSFSAAGPRAALRAYYGFDAAGIARAGRELVENRKERAK